MKSNSYLVLGIAVVTGLLGSVLVGWIAFRPVASPETMVQVIVARSVNCQEAREIFKGPSVPLVIIERENFIPLCFAEPVAPVHLLRTDKSGGPGDSLILTDTRPDGSTRRAIFYASTLEIR